MWLIRIDSNKYTSAMFNPSFAKPSFQDETEAAVAVAMFNGQQIFPGSARPLQCKQRPRRLQLESCPRMTRMTRMDVVPRFANEKITKIEGTVFEASGSSRLFSD